MVVGIATDPERIAEHDGIHAEGVELIVKDGMVERHRDGSAEPAQTHQRKLIWRRQSAGERLTKRSRRIVEARIVDPLSWSRGVVDYPCSEGRLSYTHISQGHKNQPEACSCHAR